MGNIDVYEILPLNQTLTFFLHLHTGLLAQRFFDGIVGWKDRVGDNDATKVGYVWLIDHTMFWFIYFGCEVEWYGILFIRFIE